MLDEIRDLYAYNRWANDRILDAVGALTEEQRHREIGGSFPSLHQTLLHMLGAERVWLQRWKGDSPTTLLDGDLPSDLPTLRLHWSHTTQHVDTFLAGLTEQRLSDDIEYRSVAGVVYVAPLSQLMRHVVNHATYHRGQVTTLIRQLGGTPVSTDLVVYHRANAARG